MASAELSRRVGKVVATRRSWRWTTVSAASSTRRCSTPRASRTCRGSGRRRFLRRRRRARSSASLLANKRNAPVSPGLRRRALSLGLGHEPRVLLEFHPEVLSHSQEALQPLLVICLRAVILELDLAQQLARLSRTRERRRVRRSRHDRPDVSGGVVDDEGSHGRTPPMTSWKLMELGP